MNTSRRNKSKPKSRRRRNQTAGSLIISLNQAKKELQKSSTRVSKSQLQLHEIKSELLRRSVEVQKLELELKQKSIEYRHSVEKLSAEIEKIRDAEDAMSDEEQVNYYFAQLDHLNARREIEKVDRELNKTSIIVSKKDNSNTNLSSITEAPVPLTVELPDIDLTGFIKKKGSFNFNCSTKCCICLKNEIDNIFYGCGHPCCCFTCSKKIMEKNGKCPVCGLSPKKLIKRYLI